MENAQPDEPATPEAATSTPETMVGALAWLRAQGYDHELDVRDGRLAIRTDDGFEAYDGRAVDHAFRFEGDSDPADMSIVLGISGGTHGARGVFVSSYGPEANRDHDAVLRSLDVGDRWS